MKHLSYILITITLALLACSEVFEDDIENKKINLLAPQDGVSTIETDQIFLWEYDEDITSYRFQLFEMDSATEGNIIRLVLDSISSRNQYAITLDTGFYQWQVRGENSGYKTNYFSRRLTITDENSDGLTQVALTSPVGGISVPDTNVTFIWEKLNNVNFSYRIDVSDDNGFNNIVETDLTGNDFINYSFDRPLSPKTYYWRVKAEDTDGTSGPYAIDSLVVPN